MKTLSTILTALFCAVSPVASIVETESKTEEAQSAYTLGEETVARVRKGYGKGEYKEFLKRMDVAYQGGDLSGLVQLRNDQIPPDFHEKWEKRFLELQKQKNADLMKVVSDTDDSLFAKKVRSLAATLSTPAQEKDDFRLGLLVAKAPNTGINEDENKIIEIDLEYEFKLLEASYPREDVSPSQQLEQRLALRMEKMDRLAQSAKGFQDASLVRAIQFAKARLDLELARNLDGTDLNTLVRNNVKPKTQLEADVFDILVSYQDRFSDLLKEMK